MNETTETPSTGLTGATVTTRIVSIDIFRGLTMVVMIFVNELSEVRGLPWWTYHAPAKANVMTYLDLVFPFFLFIVGMSLPLAITQRLKRSSSVPSLWLHILLRSLGLITIGLVLANADRGDPTLIGFNQNGWALIALLGAAFYLNVYPKSERHAKLIVGLRILGLVAVLAMFVLFRRVTPTGHVAWIDGSYPEILGLIGYGYLATCLFYISFRRIVWVLPVLFVALLTFNAFFTPRIISFPAHVPLYFWPWGDASTPCIITAGIITSWVFLGQHRWNTPGKRMMIAGVLGVVMLVAGWFFTPLGISKIRATPTWCLYSIGASMLLFTALYWICDVKKKTAWAFFARTAGSNTLLTYLLPDFWYFLLPLLGVTFFQTHFRFGLPGVGRAVVFTVVMLLLSAALTRAKVRLQL